MKVLLFAALATAAGSALAEDAYIDPIEGTKVGDVVQLHTPTLLFVNKKCDLQFGNAHLMRFYARYRDNNKWETGCWMRNIQGEVVIMVPKQKPLKLSLDHMARASVEKGGKARITALPKPASAPSANSEVPRP